MRQYRNVQLLGELFNEVLQKVVVYIALVQSTFSQAVFSSLLISIYNTAQYSWFEIGVVGMLQLNTSVVIAAKTGGLGQVYNTSTEMKLSCIRQTAADASYLKSKSSFKRKFLDSCPTVRVGFAW